MKLTVTNRYEIPDSAYMYFERANIILDDGSIVWIGIYEGGKHFSISMIRNQTFSTINLSDRKGTVGRHHMPLLLPINDGRFALLDLDHEPALSIYKDLDTMPVALPVTNNDILKDRHGIPRVYPVRADYCLGYWQVIFSESILSQDPRYIGKLEFDDDCYTWRDFYHLDYTQFPQNRFGSDLPVEHEYRAPIVGSLKTITDSCYVFVEGSDSASVNRYGMDYYSLVKIDHNGNMVEKLFEESDLMDLSGKHGIRSCFSTSGKYIILTPVFQSGSWKGKQKLFHLADRKLIDITLPRGTKGFRIIDHFKNMFYLTDFRNEIITSIGTIGSLSP